MALYWSPTLPGHYIEKQADGSATAIPATDNGPRYHLPAGWMRHRKLERIGASRERVLRHTWARRRNPRRNQPRDSKGRFRRRPR